MTKLSKRQLDIVKTIAAHDQPLPAHLIADKFDLSARTIQGEIASINRIMAARLIISNNKGYQIDKRLLAKLDLTITNRYEDISFLIIKELIFNKGPYDLDELADKLFYSKTTLTNKLKDINKFLGDNNLALTIKNNRAIISGHEYDKCRLIKNLIIDEVDPAFLSIENCQRYFNDMDIMVVKNIILNCINNHDYHLDDVYAENLFLNVTIVLSRMRKGFHIDNDYTSVDHSGIEYAIAKDICHKYANHYSNLDYTLKDIEYITILIIGQIKPREFTDKLKVESTENIENFAKQIRDILTNTFSYYMLNINFDSFINTFTIHISDLIKRSRNQQFLDNIIVDNIKTTCPFVYDVAVYLSKQLERQFAIVIPDTEICLISVHIGFAIENNINDNDRIKVLLVCSDYQRSASLIIQKLKDNYRDKLEIINVLSNITNTNFVSSANLIVSTIPLDIIGKKVVNISPFYTTMDNINVTNALHECMTELKKDKYKQLLLRCFHKNLFFINDTIDDKDAAIQFLGHKVEEFGLVNTGFTESVQTRESMSSTCFFDLFAIPHALEMNAKKTMFCVLINPQGLKWNNAQINIVLMIAVNKKDRRNFVKLYENIIKLLCDRDTVYDLIQSRNYTEFLDKLVA